MPQKCPIMPQFRPNRVVNLRPYQVEYLRRHDQREARNMSGEQQAASQTADEAPKSAEFQALERVYEALRRLDQQGRQRVLTSLYALLDMPSASVMVQQERQALESAVRSTAD